MKFSSVGDTALLLTHIISGTLKFTTKRSKLKAFLAMIYDRVSCYVVVGSVHGSLCLLQFYPETPGFSQTQNSANTGEFCTTSNNGKDFMFNWVAKVLTRTCGSYISSN